MRNRDIDSMVIKCHCGGNTEKTVVSWKSIPIRAWKCRRCGDEVYHPLDAQRALELRKATGNGELSVRIRRVGKSLTITIPSKLAELFGIKEGELAQWMVESDKDFRVRMKGPA